MTMTIRELLIRLSEYDPNMEVMFEAANGDTHYIDEIPSIDVTDKILFLQETDEEDFDDGYA